jgi:CheY-like chemotaxis protein
MQQELIAAGRLATVGEMAAGVAHEINNPLTGVVGFSSLLLEKDIPEDIKRDVTVIFEGAKRIASITSRMLTFSRQTKPERTLVNINDVIENTVNFQKYQLDSNKIKVSLKLAPDLPRTFADAGQLQQVFLNIIMNAEWAMKKSRGSRKLTVKTENIEETIRISFKDNGPGIPKENLEKIFNPFFTTREVGEGSGLGLSISYGIVTQHGGKIYTRSRSGSGATFFIELPVTSGGKQLKFEQPDSTVTKNTVSASILVVDDDSLVQDFLGRVLERQGHGVDKAVNADEALEKLKNEIYDIIFLDIKLPGMSGTELYEEIIKDMPQFSERVIFITGDVMNRDSVRYIQSVGIPYLTKPFDVDTLLAKIDALLNKR